jgi:hypothetical protein
MNAESRDELFHRYRSAMASNAPLVLPLIGETNRPIYDSAGVLVSVSQHAPMFVEAVNLLFEINKDNASLPHHLCDRVQKWAAQFERQT